MRERWRPVVGWEGLYEVSDRGRVRSHDRVIIKSNGRRERRPGRMLRPSPARRRDGRPVYAMVSLYVSDEPGTRHRRVRKVHQLVLEAFVGPRPAGRIGCHWSGDHSDNGVRNLYWGTPRENNLDQVRHGVHRGNWTFCPRSHRLTGANLGIRGKLRHCRACKLAGDDVRHARERHGVILDLTEAAHRRYGLIMGVAA